MVIRKVMALTRALDVLQSKRPVTAILTLGQPGSNTVQSISKVCRVLPVGAPAGPNALNAVRDWLSVLLPLTQPPAVEALLDWEANLRAATAASTKGQLMDALIKAASHGKEAVETVLAKKIAESVGGALDDDGDEE